jgi:carbohydrate kinase (thermoresistant glucokinase family)
MVIVITGPMGCGKTTIGKMLAERLGWRFYDGDDFHSVANKEKMANGIALKDFDREPWLRTLHELIQKHLEDGISMVLACSALKKKYRRMLGIDQQRVFSVFLKGSFSLLEIRIAARSHEYMSKDLLQSQLDSLEEPETGLIVDIAATPDEICLKIADNFLG